MFKLIKRIFAVLLVACAMLAVGANYAAAQTTAFTYQGRLTDNSLSPTAVYDFQFKIYTAATGGTQKGVTVTKTGVQVTNGAFSVVIDPTAAPLYPFNQGEDRYLEVSVRPGGSSAGYTPLTPRQRITSAPYAIQSLSSQFSQNAFSADNLNGIPADDYALVNDARFTDARTPIAGSSNYIQNNATTTAQTGGFNVSGNGVVGGTLTTFNAAVTNDLSVQGDVTTQGGFFGDGGGLFNLNANRISQGTVNVARIPALNASIITSGTFTTAQIPNLDAGKITTGTFADLRLSSNIPRLNAANLFTNNVSVQGDFSVGGTVTGNGSGLTSLNAASVTTGTFSDVLLSSNIPRLNTANAFSGTQSAGIYNAATQFNIGGNRILSAPGFTNTAAGFNAGNSSVNGLSNSFFGFSAGFTNVSGGSNSFFGRDAGYNNSSGDFNSFFGESTGYNNTGSGNTFIGRNAGSGNTSGSSNTFIGNGAGSVNDTGSNNTLIGVGATLNTNNLNYATAIGAGALVGNNNQVVIGRPNDNILLSGDVLTGSGMVVRGVLEVELYPTSTQFVRSLCSVPANGGPNSRRLSQCPNESQDVKDVGNFSRGLDLIKQLRPVAFTWKSNNQPDLGFVAKEVDSVEPLLATRNEKGEVEGVKYNQISAALVNAVNEQQDEIKQQKDLIERQQKQIDALTKLFCAANSNADVCKPEEK